MRRLAAALLLAGCAATGPSVPPVRTDTGATPVEAILYRDTVTVAFSDGSVCAGHRTRPGGGGWSGRLTGCDHLWRVEVARSPSSARRVLRRGGNTVRVTSPGGDTLSFGA